MNDFEEAKAAYQVLSSDRVRLQIRKKKLESQVATLEVEVPQIELETEKQRVSYEQLLAAVAGGDTAESALDSAESEKAMLEARLSRKTAMLSIAQNELSVLRVPGPVDVQNMIGRLGKAHSSMQLNKRGDFNKIRNQLVELFGGYGFDEYDTSKSWKDLLQVAFPEPDKSAIEGARDGFVQTVVAPIEKAALKAREDAV